MVATTSVNYHPQSHYSTGKPQVFRSLGIDPTNFCINPLDLQLPSNTDRLQGQSGYSINLSLNNGFQHEPLNNGSPSLSNGAVSSTPFALPDPPENVFEDFEDFTIYSAGQDEGSTTLSQQLQLQQQSQQRQQPQQQQQQQLQQQSDDSTSHGISFRLSDDSSHKHFDSANSISSNLVKPSASNNTFTRSPFFLSPTPSAVLPLQDSPIKPLNDFAMDAYPWSKNGDIYGDEEGCESFFLPNHRSNPHDVVQFEEPEVFDMDDDDDDDTNSYMFPSDDDDDDLYHAQTQDAANAQTAQTAQTAPTEPLTHPASFVSNDKKHSDDEDSNIYSNFSFASDVQSNLGSLPSSPMPPSTPPSGVSHLGFRVDFDEDFDALPTLLSPPPSNFSLVSSDMKRSKPTKLAGSDLRVSPIDDTNIALSSRSKEVSGFKRSHNRSVSQPINGILGATTKGGANRLERVIGQQLNDPFAFDKIRINQQDQQQEQQQQTFTLNDKLKSDSGVHIKEERLELDPVASAISSGLSSLSSSPASSPSPPPVSFSSGFSRQRITDRQSSGSAPVSQVSSAASARAISKRRTNTSHGGPHRCDIPNPNTGRPCGKVFSRPYDLIRHQDTIHAPVRKTYTCPMCGPDSKTFSRMDALSRHIRVKHSTTQAQATAYAHKAANQS